MRNHTQVSFYYCWHALHPSGMLGLRRSLRSRLLQDQQLPLCRHLGLESTLKATYPNLSMLFFSFPPHYIHMPYSFRTLKFPLFIFFLLLELLKCSRTFWFSSQSPTHLYHFQSIAEKSGDLAVWFSPISWRSCTDDFVNKATFFSFKLLIRYNCDPNVIRIRERLIDSMRREYS